MLRHFLLAKVNGFVWWLWVVGGSVMGLIVWAAFSPSLRLLWMVPMLGVFTLAIAKLDTLTGGKDATQKEGAADGAGSAGDAGISSDGANGHDVGQPAPEVPSVRV